MTAFERLVQILEQRYRIPPERVRLDARLAELGVDSLGMAEMLFFLEDEFKIALPREPPALVTVGDALRCVESLVEEQQTQSPGRRA